MAGSDKTEAVLALVRAIHLSPLQIKMTGGGVLLGKKENPIPCCWCLREPWQELSWSFGEAARRSSIGLMGKAK